MDPSNLISQWFSGYPAGWERLLSMIGIEVHWFILQYVIGLPFLAVIAEAIWLKTKNEQWKRLSRTLAKGFVMVFAVGAATGTASEFGLVLLWPNLTEAAGRYIYFPLYMEVFAFLMEVAFIYMYFYAENKLSPKVHLLVGILAFAGAWYSAAMILSVNSFMQAAVNVLAKYDPITGKWAPPEVLLFVPTELAKVLDVNALKSVGVSILGTGNGFVKVTLPSGLVRTLMSEAFAGKTVGESTLALVVKKEALSSVSGLPLKVVIDQIVATTVMNAGTFMITFLSGGYLATFFHVIGAAIAVSAFTIMGGYSLRLLKMPDSPDREFFMRALKFAALVALLAIAYQGFISGHEMGVAVAKHNPEKFAAMEGTSSKIKTLPSLVGMKDLVEKQLMPMMAYGNPNAKLPVYDKIDAKFRPPLIIHYMYYTKIGLGVLLGLIALVATFYVFFRAEVPKWLLTVLVISPAIAQLTSFLGWGVRELGRKPWAIYGIMDVQTELTINPPPAWQLAGVALYLTAILVALVLAVYWFLWKK